ncbi:MAG: hypothetical protein KME10_02755 [Plectolyngbya sp. WJT66-NPBG17]|nr:hypothetical protein [Plectolyngbya sp. WJT66-NPBG17]MBW4527275.1 hypothetical protein [Phormidium tanganyikae FI6-MK23]
MQCPACKFVQAYKNGYRRGVQSYRCRRCGRQFLESYRQPRYSDEIKQRCLDLYFTGLGVKAIERVTNIHHTTVSYWIQKIDVEKVDLYALSPESLPGSKR